MGCKLRWIDRELLENHSPTFWRFLKELRIVLHIKEMYFIKQKCSEHYALFLRVTLGLFKITVIAETCSMRWCDGVGCIRETFLCLRVQMFVFATRSGHFHSSENRRLYIYIYIYKKKRKQVSLFYNTFFQHAFLLLCHVHIAILNPDMMWTSAGSIMLKMILIKDHFLSRFRRVSLVGFRLECCCSIF